VKRFLSSPPGLVATIGLIALLAVAPTWVGAPVASDSRTVMQVIISLIVLTSALIVILSKKYPDDVQKWAFGVVGTIVGYWLPS